MTKECPLCGSSNISTTTNHKLKKGLGHVANAAVGFGLGWFLGDVGVAIAENVDFTGAVTNENKCNRCHYTWKEGEPTVQRIPDSYIIEQKNLIAMKMRRKPSDYMACAIPIALGSLGFYYCYTHERGFLWWVIAICIVGMCIWALALISDFLDQNRNAKDLERMSVSQFMTTTYFDQVINNYKKIKGIVTT